MQGWVRAGHSIEGEVMSKTQVFVGIDVAQATLEVALRPTGEAWQVANDEIAFGDLVERVRQLKPSLIVLEATGGIHLPVVAALAAQSYRSWQSIPDRRVISPKPPASWQRLTVLTPRSWPILPRQSVRKSGPCRMQRRRSWPFWSLAAVS